MDNWGRSTLLLLGAAIIAACPHDFTRPGRDGGSDRAADSYPRDLARDTPCRTDEECDDSRSCTEDTCKGGRCSNVPKSGYCHIGGACLAEGDANPANPCERCEMSAQSRFTPFLGKGCVLKLAGTSTGFADGPASAAMFYDPTGIAVASSGVVYVADLGNHRVRKISEGEVSTVAGAGKPGLQDGAGATALFHTPRGLTRSPLDGLAVADTENNAIRRVDPRSLVVSTLLGGAPGFDDGPAATAKLERPYSVAYGPGGIYFAAGYRIRLIADDGPRTVSTLAGSGATGFKNGPAASAEFSYVDGLAALDLDNIFVADTGNNRIRLIRRGVTAEVVAVAGVGTYTFSDGPGDQAGFRRPSGLAIASVTSSSVVLYVADKYNHRIRKVSVLRPSMLATVHTLAGDGTSDCRDGTLATAQFNQPTGLAVDNAGRIYVAEWGDTIRVIDP